MGYIQTQAGDYFGGQESLLASIKYLHPERDSDQYCLLSDYNVLGNNSRDLKNFDAAVGYFDSSLKLLKDERYRPIALNNKALAFQKKGEYSQAIGIYESILDSLKANKKEYARVMSNLARARWQRDPRYRAAPELLAALAIRRGLNDEWGMNASFSHLADYYSRTRPDSALGYARQMLAIAGRLNSPDDKLEALEKLIKLGPPVEVKAWFAELMRLKDSVETARNAAKNQFALIRYEGEKNRADIARLERENAERRTEVLRNKVISGSAVLMVIVLVLGGIVWFRNHKKKMQMERDKAILRTSQKVHDVVANGLYRVITEIEHGASLDKDELLDKMDVLYQRSRDISYEPVGPVAGDFAATIAKLLMSFGDTEAGRKVLITGNDEAQWAAVETKTKSELEEILLELMINMKKHSGARNVVVQFGREGSGLSVRYSDDGVGMRGEVRFGKGLTGTENRIMAMGGRIIFDQETSVGTKAHIYLPNA
jgi:tetratricopeptide (TPR) repeat protein